MLPANAIKSPAHTYHFVTYYNSERYCESLINLTPHIRNVPDQVLKRLPENGGILMVSFIPNYNVQERSAWEAAFKQATGGIMPKDPNYGK